MATTTARPIVPGVWGIKLGIVNAFLVDIGDGLAVIDTGIPGSAPRIVEAVRSIGRKPTDVRHLFVTHCHADHAGGLAELKRLTGAPAWMHPADAALVRDGRSMRPMVPTPGLLNAAIIKFAVNKVPTTIEPAEVEHEIHDGDTLPGGLVAYHVPGHCAGQVALLRPDGGGFLFAADTASHALWLVLSPMYEDRAEGLRSLARLATLTFDGAGFGHGGPIREGASAKFVRKFGT